MESLPKDISERAVAHPLARSLTPRQLWQARHRARSAAAADRGGAASPSLRQEVVRLALPSVAERILSLTVNIINTILVGHLGASALAAVGLSGTIEMIGSSLFMAVGTGATALVAQAVGARNHALAQRVLEQAMLVAVVMGLLFLGLFLPLTRQTLVLLGAEEEAVALGVRYLPFLSGTLPMVSVLYVGNAALRGAGDTRTPMIVMAIMNLVNLVLSLVFIRGWGPLAPMGVAGAGLAAGVARTVAGVATYVVLRGNRRQLSLRRLINRPQRDVLAKLLQVGLPAAGETILMRIAFLSYTRAISSLGTVSYAAHVIAERVENISFMPAYGFSVAATTLSGQALGAGDIKRARESVFRAIEIAVTYALLTAGFFAAFPRLMLGLFTNDAAVVNQGLVPLRTLALAQPIMAIAFSLSGGLRGAGDTRSVMWITGAGAMLVRVPLSILAATVLGLGLPGVYMSMTLDWLTRLILLWWRFRPSTWQRRAEFAARAVRGDSAEAEGDAA